MWNHEPKGYDCPFCHIIRHEPTEHGDQEPDVVLRTKKVTAFISSKWWQSSKGHVIVVPNEHFENLYDLPNTIGRAIFDVSKQVAIALKEGTNATVHRFANTMNLPGTKAYGIIICIFFLATRTTPCIEIMTTSIGQLPRKNGHTQRS